MMNPVPSVVKVLFFLLLLNAGLFAQLEESKIQVADGFEVKRVYAVPGQGQGSWVALTVDKRGRLIGADQDGGLYRVTLDAGVVVSVEPLELEIGHVNALAYVFDSLYAVVADNKDQSAGLYRIRDLNADDRFDDIQLLRPLVGQGEHGPHSIIPGPDGKWLYLIAGNKTEIPYGDGFDSWVPQHWGEDDLLPRLWGPIGSERGTTAPGGWIARTDPEGQSWKLLAIGFRNAFDIAFNDAGDLFTTDADAEFDMATPWYQPTRLLHVVKGTDYGWRSGSGKWPGYLADTVPPVYEYGPGSPTGITFGYGANFPKKYQQALFACDWSWGRVFVTWMKPHGASYTGVTEQFLSGIPLPIADLVVNPKDGAMYFVLGGRGATSGLYRITYVGSEAEIETAAVPDRPSGQQADRKALEALINTAGENDIPVVWPYLSNKDRVLRHTARLVLEHMPPAVWRDRALAEPDPKARMTALLGLARSGDQANLPDILAALLELDWNGFNTEEKFLGLRCFEVTLIRMGTPDALAAHASEINAVRRLLESRFTAADDLLFNAERLKLLVFLGSSHATALGMDWLEAAVTQVDKLRFILPLRVQTHGWTRPLREAFFAEIAKAQGWPGGKSLTKYVEMIVVDALNSAPEEDRVGYRELIAESRPEPASIQTSNRPFVKLWTLDDLLPVSEKDLEDRDAVNGRRVFTEAACFACHRVNGEGGGVGPDLSAVTRRFGTRDILEAIVEPGKVVSDQYAYVVIDKTDGTRLHGKVVNYYGESIGLQTDSLNAANIIRVPRQEIVTIEQSPVSPMPPALLSTFTKGDILDMLAYLREAAGVLSP
jgi:putative heme-binding domain-containing protein